MEPLLVHESILRCSLIPQACCTTELGVTAERRPPKLALSRERTVIPRNPPVPNLPIPVSKNHCIACMWLRHFFELLPPLLAYYPHTFDLGFLSAALDARLMHTQRRFLGFLEGRPGPVQCI